MKPLDLCLSWWADDPKVSPEECSGYWCMNTLDGGATPVKVVRHRPGSMTWDAVVFGFKYEGFASAESAAKHAEWLFARELEKWVRDMGGRVAWSDEERTCPPEDREALRWRAGEFERHNLWPGALLEEDKPKSQVHG